MTATLSAHDNALFQGVPAAAVEPLTRALRPLPLAAGEVLFREGDPGGELYLVLDGLIQIYSAGAGDDVTITTFLPGSYFGELALLGEARRSASARAMEDSVLLAIDRATFAAITSELPQVFANVNRALSERLVATTRALVDEQRGRLTLIAVSDVEAWQPVMAYLWSAVAAIGGGPTAVMAPRGTLPHATSVTAALRTNQRPARAQPGDEPAFFAYRGGSLIEARAATGAIGALADYFRRWWRQTIVFVGAGERAWAEAALPWVDRLLIVGELDELTTWPAHWPTSGPHGSKVEAVPLVRAAHEQAAAGSRLRRHGFATPHIFLPERATLDAQARGGFQRTQLTDVALPEQRGLLRLARAAAGARVGLALGAGGARGLAHIGVVRRLEELGIVPDAIAGTSMGALVGAGLASGLDSHGAEAAMQQGLASRIRRLLRPAFSRRSIFSPRGIEGICRWLYADTAFADLVTPLGVLATDLVSGRGIVLRDGPVARAVQASITIPGIFPPVVHGAHVFVDGGVCEPVPTAALAGLGADITIAVNISVTPEDMERWALEEGAAAARRPIREGSAPNILDTYLATMNIAVSDRAHAATRAADVAIRPRFRSSSWREFTHGPDHLRRGYLAACDAEEQLRRAIRWLDPPT